MLVSILILIVIVLLMIGLLMLPIIITIDSHRKFFEVGLWKILKMNLITQSTYPFIKFQLTFLGYSTEIKFPQNKTNKKKRKAPNRKEKKSRNNTFSFIKSIIKTFYINRLNLTIDSGNFVTNAYLYPLFYSLSIKNICLSVNNQNKNEIELIMTNRPIKILLAVLKNI